MSLGAALFWPAAEIMNYTLFLVGLFIIAAGLGCLETAANPFVTVLGPESSGHFRLNLAQTFNSFGAIIAVVFGQSLILSNVPHQSQDVLDKMSPEQLSAYKHSLVLSVQTPYMIIVAIVLLVALLIMLTKFRHCRVIITVTPNKDRSPHRFLAWRVFVTGAGRY